MSLVEIDGQRVPFLFNIIVAALVLVFVAVVFLFVIAMLIFILGIITSPIWGIVLLFIYVF